jgi:hypothetical protein
MHFLQCCDATTTLVKGHAAVHISLTEMAILTLVEPTPERRAHEKEKGNVCTAGFYLTA